MDFEIRTEGMGEVLIFSDLPEDIKRLNKLPANCFTLLGDWGKATFLHYHGNGFTISFNDYRVNFDTILTARSNTSILELNVSMGSPIIGTWDGVSQPVLSKNQFSLNYTPHVQTRASFRTNDLYSSCDFHFSKSFLWELAADFPLLDEFMSKVEKGKEPAALAQRNLYCSADMLANIRFIESNAYSYNAQRLLVEYKVKEILIAALETASTLAPKRDIKLHPSDEEALLKLKVYIETHLDQMPSLKELAKMAGLNEDKVKKGFSKLFGTTPYDYHIRLKMEVAKRLLLDTGLKIFEIAYEVGYHHSSNFCIQFEKLFGCQPSYFRKYGRSKI